MIETQLIGVIERSLEAHCVDNAVFLAEQLHPILEANKGLLGSQVTLKV